MKMIGDYYRYECEFLVGDERDAVIAKSDERYWNLLVGDCIATRML